MQAQRQRDTLPELKLRRELHRRGLRYFVHRQPVPGLRRQADIVFPRARVAVWVDGCFWHGCPEHGKRDHAVNAEFWSAKLQKTADRDRDTDARATAEGWAVVRVWEHEDHVEVADRILDLVRSRVGTQEHPLPT